MPVKQQPPKRRWGAVALFVLLFLALVTVRATLVISAVKVHNDERHYALDGFWVKSEMPASIIWSRLLRGHVSDHVLYNPRTDEVKRHGEYTRGFHSRDDDLARFPRAGHPPLYMIMLGGIFLLFTKAWLHVVDHYVFVSRVLNTTLDCFTWLMLYQMLRQSFGRSLSLWVMVPVALMPYTLILGSTCYLDGPGTFMIVLCAWVYQFRLRTSAAAGWWILVGLLLGAGVLMKQSNVFAVPLLAGVAWIWPPKRKMKQLMLPAVLMAVAAVGIIFAGCNPKDLVGKTMSAVELTREFDTNRHVARNGFLRIAYLVDPTSHYHFGVTERRPRRFVRSMFLVRAHFITFPLLLLSFTLAVIILAALRRWRALILPLIIGMITMMIPFGSVVRRLYLLLPFVVLTVALAIHEVIKRKGARAV